MFNRLTLIRPTLRDLINELEAAALMVSDDAPICTHGYACIEVVVQVGGYQSVELIGRHGGGQ